MKQLLPWLSPLLLGLPGVALADTLVLAPLYGKGAADMQVVNVTALIASELDFRPEFDNVVEITKTPSSAACLTTASCLSTLAKEGGGTQLVTGTLTTSATTFTLDLVYFDAKAGSVIRRQSFTLSSEPEAIADGMTGIVKELLTGAVAAPPSAAKAAAADEFTFTPAVADDDDFEFEEPAKPAATSPAKLAEERKAAEAERLRRAEEERKAEAERVRREEEERLRREEEERRRKEEADRVRREEEERIRYAAERKRVEDEAAAAEAERRRKEEERKAASVVAFDPSMITFGGSTADIKVESAATRPAPAPAPRPAPARPADDSFDFEDLDGDADSFAVERPRPVTSRDLDEEEEDLDRVAPAPKPRTTAPAPTSRPAPKPPARKPQRDEDGYKVQITLRGGYAPFQTGTGTFDSAGNPVGGGLQFITYGGDVGIPVGGTGLHVLAGVEGWSVSRLLPLDLQQEVGRATWWNTIVPFNAGLAYKFDTGTIAVPTVGADVIMALYYTDQETQQGYWAVGPRARLGVDLMVTPRFGLTLGANVGVWSGKQWVAIEQGMKNSAILPQIQGGTVFSF